MYKSICFGLTCLFSLRYVCARDSRFYEITSRDPRRFRNPQQRYIDIYTNHPNVDSILKSYQSLQNEKYVYPKSPYNANNVHGSDYYNPSNTNEDYIKFDTDVISKFDTLQSDYGDFDDYFANSKNKTPNDRDNFFYNRGRPNFRTGKNRSEENKGDTFDYDYFTNIQKIPRYDKLKSFDKDGVSLKIHNLLKKYLLALFKKVHSQNDDDREELLDASSEVHENIETLDHSKETEGDQDNLFEVIDEEAHAKLNATKGKFLDPTKLIILKNSTKFLANKFLSLFTIIQFPNTRCTGSNGVNTYEGTCYYQTECDSRNGTVMGSCADGYGVCCVFVRTCGGSSNQNCSYFESPNYPNYYPSNGTVVPPPTAQTPNGTIDPRLRYQLMMYLARQESTTNSLSCTFQVTKSSKSVRQLKVDFLDLELRGPTNGSCINERLVISGQNTNDIIPVICGYNTGQHIYIDVTDVTGPIQFQVLSTTVERKRFRIRVCQITDCSNPQNCLQYYTGTQAVITSFNYDQTSSLSRSTPGYFNNLNYAICIRKEAGYCSITYSNVINGTTYPFQLVNFDDAGLNTVPPGQAGAEIFSCPDDYIVINGIRLCGDRLNDGSTIQDFTRNAPVTDTGAGPIVVPFRTDRAFTGRGFRLLYTQNRCT